MRLHVGDEVLEPNRRIVFGFGRVQLGSERRSCPRLARGLVPDLAQRVQPRAGAKPALDDIQKAVALELVDLKPRRNLDQPTGFVDVALRDLGRLGQDIVEVLLVIRWMGVAGIQQKESIILCRQSRDFGRLGPKP